MAKLKTFEQVVQGIVDAFNDKAFDDKIANAAREICKRHRPTIRGAAASKIKSRVGNKAYVDCFYVKKIGDQYGAIGYALHNRKYQLSHLLERPHQLNFTGRYTHNEYHFWENESKQMVKEFNDEVSKIIDEQIKKGIK